MLTDRARSLSSGIVTPIVRVLAGIGATPNTLTVLGSVAHVPVAWLLATGHLRLGALALALAAAVDALDGSLARLTGTASRFGAFLDSTLDRVSEVLVFCGLLVYLTGDGGARGPALALLALAGSLLVSYTRARSEGLGCGTKAGFLGRFERMAILTIGLLLGLVEPVLWLLVAGTWVTVAQRVLDVRRMMADGECGD